MLRRNHRHERGSILLLSYLMAASVLLVLGQIFATRTLSETNLTQRFMGQQLARLSAEAGLEDTMAQLTDNSTYVGTDANSNNCADPGDWQPVGASATMQQFCTAVIATSNPNRFQITAQGRSSSFTRSVVAYVQRGGTPPFQFAAFGTDTVPFGIDVNTSAATWSYDSSTDPNATTHKSNAHVGTNSISTAPYALRVGSGSVVNGGAKIGPGGDVTQAISGSANITGGTGLLPAVKSYPTFPIPSPFTMSASPSPNAPNSDDPNDWKNAWLPPSNPSAWPPFAWRDEIEGSSSFQSAWNAGGVTSTSLAPTYVTCSGSPTTCTLNSPTVTVTGCGSYYVPGKLIMTASTGLTNLTFNCSGGVVALRIEGSLNISSSYFNNYQPSDTLSGVNGLRVDGDVTVSMWSTIQFTGSNPSLYMRGALTLTDSSDSRSVPGHITGLHYLYADESPFYGGVRPDSTDTTSTVSPAQITLVTIANASYPTLSFDGPGSVLYAEGRVNISTKGQITGLERLYSGFLTSSSSTYAVDCNATYQGETIQFANSPQAALYTVGAIRVNGCNVGTNSGPMPAWVYAGNMGNGVVNPYAISAGTLSGGLGGKTVYAEGSVGYSPDTCTSFFVNQSSPLSRLFVRGSYEAQITAAGDYSNTVYVKDWLHPCSWSSGAGTIFVGGNLVNDQVPLTAKQIYVAGTGAWLQSGSAVPQYTLIDVRGSGWWNFLAPPTTYPKDLLVATPYSSSLSTDAVRLSGTTSKAVIYAPQVPVVMTSGALLKGAVIGRTVSMDSSNTAIGYDETLANQAFSFSPPSVTLLATKEN